MNGTCRRQCTEPGGRAWRLVIALLVLSLGAALIGPAGAGRAQGPDTLPPDVAATIQALLDETTASGVIPGVALRIETPRLTFSAASGVQDRATGALMTPNAAFPIGSVTKMFTAVLVLQLAEQGVLALDDPLAAWLPEIAARLPHGDAITLRHLLQHTSGVADYIESLPFLMAYLGEPTAIWEPNQIIEQALLIDDAAFAPGTAWAYSNTNYVLLGLVLERAAGQPVAEQYRARIFAPLGLADTVMAGDGAPPPTVVHGYSTMVPGQDMADTTAWSLTPAWTAGAIISTPGDMAHFLRALFAGELFQQPETLAAMLDVARSQGGRYGLGVMQFDPYTWGHIGGIPGYVTHVLYAPDDALAIVVMMNGDADVTAGVLDDVLVEALPYLTG